jgi:ankyrin repeat protein
MRIKGVFILIFLLLAVLIYSDNKKELIFKAISAMDIYKVQSLITKETDLNFTDKKGRNPLFYALPGYTDNEVSRKLIYILIKNGVDINHRDFEGNTVLHEVCRRGFFKTVKFLVKLGANIKIKNNFGLSPVYFSKNKKILDFMIKNKAKIESTNVNKSDNYGNTPIFYAVKNNNINLVRMLINKGACINVVNKDGNTPVHIAAIYGRYFPVKLLINRGAFINIYNLFKKTPLELALGMEEYVINERLRYEDDSIDKIEREKEMIIKELINNNADVFIKDSFGDYLINDIIERGYNPNIKYKNGDTLLSMAVNKGKYDVVKKLLKKKADVNEKNNGGLTPLHIASFKGYERIVILLLKNKADVNIKNIYGWSPLLISSNEKITKILIKYGAKFEKESIVSRDKKGKTPLVFAVISENLFLIKSLFKNGADPNCIDIDGRTPLTYAVLANAKVVRLLLKYNAKTNFKDKFGKTPLDYAVENGNKEIIKLLKKYGAKRGSELGSSNENY